MREWWQHLSAEQQCALQNRYPDLTWTQIAIEAMRTSPAFAQHFDRAGVRIVYDDGSISPLELNTRPQCSATEAMARCVRSDGHTGGHLWEDDPVFLTNP